MFTTKHLTSSLTNILSIIQAKILESSFTSSFLSLTPHTHSINKYWGICFWNTARIWTHHHLHGYSSSWAHCFVPLDQLQKLPTGFLLFPCPHPPSLVSTKQPEWTSKNVSLNMSVLAQHPSDISSRNKSGVLKRCRGPPWSDPNQLPCLHLQPLPLSRTLVWPHWLSYCSLSTKKALVAPSAWKPFPSPPPGLLVQLHRSCSVITMPERPGLNTPYAISPFTPLLCCVILHSTYSYWTRDTFLCLLMYCLSLATGLQTPRRQGSVPGVEWGLNQHVLLLLLCTRHFTTVLSFSLLNILWSVLLCFCFIDEKNERE